MITTDPTALDALKKLRAEIEPMAQQIICPKENTFTRQLQLIDGAVAALESDASFSEAIKFVAAHLHRMGKSYIEIAVDPQTKEIGWSFTATLSDSRN